MLPRLGEVNLDARVLLFTCTVAVAAAVLAGIVPAWRLTRTNPNDALKQGIGRTQRERRPNGASATRWSSAKWRWRSCS